ncbi:DUF4156 domain-containing protein [Francisellaceae bacterium]|nr:DUF4156 domain-containing protein [Francisellaceae bacterium]
MHNLKFILLLVIILSSITACSITPANGNRAKNTYISSKAPNNCDYKGMLFSSDGNWFTGIFTSNITIIISSRNKLKNQAAANGANYVHLQETHADDTTLIIGGNQNVVFVGHAYYCENINEAIRVNGR